MCKLRRSPLDSGKPSVNISEQLGHLTEGYCDFSLQHRDKGGCPVTSQPPKLSGESETVRCIFDPMGLLRSWQTDPPICSVTLASSFSSLWLTFFSLLQGHSRSPAEGLFLELTVLCSLCFNNLRQSQLVSTKFLFVWVQWFNIFLNISERKRLKFHSLITST